MPTAQNNLEGEAVGTKATVATRSRPSIVIQTTHYELKTNVKTLVGAREKGTPKMKEKVRVRQSKIEDIVNLSPERRDAEIQAIVEAAMVFDVPSFDEDWVVLQAGSAPQ